MGFATTYDVWVMPLVRDWQVFFSALAFYFVCQYMLVKYLPRWMGRHWEKLSTLQREDMVVRGCSIINGLVMSGSAVLFLSNFVHNGFGLPDDKYKPLKHYSFYRTTITAYFAWDVVTCFRYKWSVAWKVHGVFSFLGTYTLMFPFSDDYGGYYTGCFELSNAFLHVSIILRTLAGEEKNAATKAVLENRATLCEYTFGVLFFIIRVIGGTYVTGTWMYTTLSDVLSDFVHRGDAGYKQKLHNEAAVALAILAVSTIQILQYIWFVAIIPKGDGQRC
ncbi:hypothetical protein STCU_04676 [Strigomonas culicis]|uniref:TLC domain-containing protein n=1 Tax=Strigomonas culicis TaxID=28005 RepID=S9UEH4_9TRYP|nr:hypothetical protein STCU_04676 [Strigomonas culicis]|eukprot:EPY29197.1 hypothetical protein STCU_04676 [Strigomonas culicis]